MKIQKGYGCAFGGGTIVNAIATWSGCAYATEMKTYAEVLLHEEKTSRRIVGSVFENEKMNPHLIELCVQFVLEELDCSKKASVLTRSEIPIAGGLKSSSAAANACVLAALDALGETMEPSDIVKLGVRAAKEAGVTITGAFDDACASFYGGVAVTENKTLTLLKREEFHYDVFVLNPGKAFSSETNVSRSVLMKDLVQIAFDSAFVGEYKTAMKLNGLIYCGALGFNPEPAVSCMEIGEKFDVVAGLSGTGPSFTALFPTSDSLGKEQNEELNVLKEKIKLNWKLQYPNAAVFETKTSNKNAYEESVRFSKFMKENQTDLKSVNLKNMKF